MTSINKKFAIFFLPLLSVVVFLWRLLLPGYVLSLDLVFTPHILPPHLNPGDFLNTWVIYWPMYWVSLVLPGWIVEKGMLIGLFFALPVLAYHCILPRTSSKQARIWAALLYTMNPFVYTRFLAGQWLILLAYACLPLVLYFSFQTQERDLNVRRSFFLALSIAAVFACSLHLGVMALCVWLFVSLGTMPFRSARAWMLNAFTAVMLFVMTAYWTVPAFIHRGSSILQAFGAQNLQAFHTASDPVLGTIGNVLALYGFWGEHEPWATQFIWVKSFPVVWAIAGIGLASFIAYGIFPSWRRDRRLTGSLIMLTCLALIFSCGIGNSPFFGINQWIFTHVSFWRGFRDSQKWSAVIALVYAYFGGLGVDGLWKKVAADRLVFLVTSFFVLLYTFPMLFGFWNQLKPVWYPSSWTEVNRVLQIDPQCKAIFLPWHMFYASTFAHGVLIANPARPFFQCQIVESQNVELNGIHTQSAINPAYDAIDGAVTGSDGWLPEQEIEVLRQAGIHYAIDTHDMTAADPFIYSFLKIGGIQVQRFGEIRLYRF